MNAFVENKVNRKIFHGRIEEFFHHLWRTVDFVHKQYIPFLEMREETDEITAFFKCRTGCGDKIAVHFIGNDMGQRGLTQTRWTVEQHVVYGFLPFLRRFNGDLQGFHDL